MSDTISKLPDAVQARLDGEYSAEDLETKEKWYVKRPHQTAFFAEASLPAISMLWHRSLDQCSNNAETYETMLGHH